MKKILSLYAVVFIALIQSCAKDKEVTPKQNGYTGSFTVTSPKGGGNALTYHPGEYIAVTWKSNDVPAGALVMANLVYTDPATQEQYATVLQPQTKVITAYDGTTLNDGNEVFQLTPTGTRDGNYLYDQGGYGDNFKIKIFAMIPDRNGVWGEGGNVKEGLSEGTFIIEP